MSAPAKRPSMLYWGDNLPILRNRDYFPSESVDLVYRDPPFKSNEDYNVLFSEADGTRSAAQIEAFSDTWRWDVTARQTFDETLERGGRAAEALGALRTLVGGSDELGTQRHLDFLQRKLVTTRRNVAAGSQVRALDGVRWRHRGRGPLRGARHAASPHLHFDTPLTSLGSSLSVIPPC